MMGGVCALCMKTKEERDVIDVLKMLWLVKKLMKLLMHVCTWHQYSLTSEFLKVPNLYLIELSFIHIASSGWNRH
jgi:hypothetical protein